MNKLQLKGSWNGIKGKFKQRFGKFLQGKADELWGRLQKTLGRWTEGQMINKLCFVIPIKFHCIEGLSPRWCDLDLEP
jgi:uncharacterized protein YjbJ (UPF0337 family)